MTTKTAGWAAALTGGAAIILMTSIGPAAATCTLWPGKNDSAFQACMQAEQQVQQLRREMAQQRYQNVRTQLQIRQLQRRNEYQ
jgi:TolA-binding protein